jgi:hypothetical protein
MQLLYHGRPAENKQSMFRVILLLRRRCSLNVP